MVPGFSSLLVCFVLSRHGSFLLFKWCLCVGQSSTWPKVWWQKMSPLLGAWHSIMWQSHCSDILLKMEGGSCTNFLPHESNEIFEFYLHAFEFGKLNIRRIKWGELQIKKQVHGINLMVLVTPPHQAPLCWLLFVVVGSDGSASKSSSWWSLSPGNNGQLLLIRSQANEMWKKRSHNCTPKKVFAIIPAHLISQISPMCLAFIFTAQHSHLLTCLHRCFPNLK